MRIGQTLNRWYGLFGHWLNLKRQSAENRHLLDKLSRYTPILIYQMGKVGSSSIYWPLKKVYPGAVIHIHNMREDHPAEEVRILYRYLKESPDKEIKIISLVRDPIARNVSAFFQNFERFVGVRAEEYTGSIQELQKLFIEKYPHHIPHDWFNNRLKRDFNIDVFESPFLPSGHKEYSQRNFSALVLKQSLDDQIKERRVREFTAIPSFSMKESKNQGSDKLYADLYHRFKSAGLPTHYLEAQLSSTYAQHFFSEEERVALRSRWQS